MILVAMVSIHSPPDADLPTNSHQAYYSLPELPELTEQEKDNIATLLIHRQLFQSFSQHDQVNPQMLEEMLAELRQECQKEEVSDIYASGFSALVQWRSGKYQEKVISQYLTKTNKDLVAPAVTLIWIILQLRYTINHDPDTQALCYNLNNKLREEIVNHKLREEIVNNKLYEGIARLLAPLPMYKTEISASHILFVLIHLHKHFTKNAYIEYSNSDTKIPLSSAEELMQLDQERKKAQLAQQKKSNRELKARSQFHSVSVPI